MTPSEIRSKVAKGEPLTQNELLNLANELEYLRSGVAYLADCNAATMEGLTASASKSTLERFSGICRTSKGILTGEWQAYHHTNEAGVIRRCDDAIQHAQLLASAKTQKKQKKIG